MQKVLGSQANLHLTCRQDSSLSSLPGDPVLDVVQKTLGHQGVFIQVHQVRGLNRNSPPLDTCPESISNSISNMLHMLERERGGTPERSNWKAEGV